MITSTSNQQIKTIRKLRDRKERQALQLAYVEGLRLVIEGLQQNAGIETVLYAPELLTSQAGFEAIEQARSRNIEILEVSAEVFESISAKDAPQGIGAVVRQRWERLESVTIQPGDLWVSLVEVSDPGNLGTILRTLDSVGGTGLILLDHSTDPYDPTAIRASMGALFSLKLVKTTREKFSIWQESNPIAVVGAAGDGVMDYHAAQYPETMILMMGSERHGFLPAHQALCHKIVRIPMVGRSDSLNLAVATGIILYEIFNQRRDQKGRP